MGGGDRWLTRLISGVSNKSYLDISRTLISGDCGLGERRRVAMSRWSVGRGWVSGLTELALGRAQPHSFTTFLFLFSKLVVGRLAPRA